jgi:hypothetical protein
VQRFGDGLNLNIHFHVLALDGVFDADDAPRMRFIALAPPDDGEILRVLEGFKRRLARVLDRRGLGSEADDRMEAGDASRQASILPKCFMRSRLQRIDRGRLCA